MSWAFSIGDFLIPPAAAAAAEIPARPQENGAELGRSGGKYATAKRASFVRTTSPAHKQREAERERERNWIGKGDGSARARSLSRRLIIDGVICLKTDALRSLLGIGS